MASKTWTPSEVEQMRKDGRIDIRLSLRNGTAEVLVDGDVVATLADLNVRAYFDRITLEEAARRYGRMAITRW